MYNPLIIAAIALLFGSTTVCHAEVSAGASYAASSAAVSLGSSALVSGIILSPVLLPVSLIMASVEKDDKQKTALLTAKTPDKKEVKMKVPLKVVEKDHLKTGDLVILEKAPEGTGAYLKKDGKILTHMVSQQDSGLSGNQPVPAK
ncbi:MAG TPA: STM0539 family protein [Scandinavium sp.]|jgi:hypothetical protein